MDWEAIQSASLAAVKTIMEDQSFDVLWNQQYEAGYVPADRSIRITPFQGDVIGQHIRLETSGGQVVEKQWNDIQLIMQFDVETTNQSLVSSSHQIANRVRGGWWLQPIQDLCKEADLSPVGFGSIIDTGEVKDRDRWRSACSFEVTFNATELVQLTNLSGLGCIEAVEYSGSVTGSDGVTIYPVDGFITAAYHPSGVSPELVAQFTEGLIYFTWESEKSASFSLTFPKDPNAVTLDILEDYQNSGGVLIQGIDYDLSGVNVRVSAPFSGTMRYRAIWSQATSKYPFGVVSSIYPVVSGNMTASAGRFFTSALSGNPRVDFANYFFGTGSLPSAPNDFFITHWDLNRGAPIPFINVDSVGTTSVTGTLAAPFAMPNGGSAGKFDHIAFLTSSV